MKSNYNTLVQLSRKIFFIAWSTIFISSTAFGQANNLTNLTWWFSQKSLAWSAETNGFRTGVWLSPDPPTPAKEIEILVLPSTNSGLRYVYPPSDKSPSLELRDTNGVVIQAIKNKMDGELPQSISENHLRSWKSTFRMWGESFLGRGHGVYYDYFLIATNFPNMLKVVDISDVYKIKKEADYTLTVFPVIYKFETNYQYADRIDLPCVTTKIHLAPSQ